MIPLWVINSLGKSVILSKPYKEINHYYPAGSTGCLISIQAGDKRPYATVILDASKTQSEENFEFNSLRPFL